MIQTNKNPAKEYLTVSIHHGTLQICRECYQTLGWEIRRELPGFFTSRLIMERNKKMENKLELCELQREMESVLMEIEELYYRHLFCKKHPDKNLYFDYLHRMMNKAIEIQRF